MLDIHEKCDSLTNDPAHRFNDLFQKSSWQPSVHTFSLCLIQHFDDYEGDNVVGHVGARMGAVLSHGQGTTIGQDTV